MTNLSDRCEVDRKNHAHHKIVVSSLRWIEAESPVPTEGEYCRSKNIARYLHQKLRGKKCCPAVHATWTLAKFYESTSWQYIWFMRAYFIKEKKRGKDERKPCFGFPAGYLLTERKWNLWIGRGRHWELISPWDMLDLASGLRHRV